VKKSYKEKIIKLEDRISQLDDANRMLGDELSRTHGRVLLANERSGRLEQERNHAWNKLHEMEEQGSRLTLLGKELARVRESENDYKVRTEEAKLQVEAAEVALRNLKQGMDESLGR